MSSNATKHLLSNTNPMNYLKEPVHNSMFLTHVTKNEIINNVKFLFNKKSLGYDGISMSFIKRIIYSIVLSIN